MSTQKDQDWFCLFLWLALLGILTLVLWANGKP
jgi:hypothetical protein